MKQALLYSLKIWLTTIIIGPLIMGVRIYFMYDWVYERLMNAFKVPELGIPMGIVLYLPCWLLFGIIVWYLSKKTTIIYRKVYFSFISVVFSIIPFVILNGYHFFDFHTLFSINNEGLFAGFPPDLFWTFTYVGLTLAGVWFYKLKPANVKATEVKLNPK